MFLAEVRDFLSGAHTGEWRSRLDLSRASDHGLSAREAQVLELICDGASDQEIARLLGIERRTASNHVETMLRKIGARSRAHSVAWAVHKGLFR